MYGKLNYHIGARAHEEGRRSLFPSVDFCQNPQEICSGQYSYSLMWITGLFAWMESVQSQPDYSENLGKVVNGDMRADAFIDAISDSLGIRDKKKMDEMRSNFQLALESVGLLGVT
jgi:hypothetical protein